MNNFATASRPLRPEVSKALKEQIRQQEEQDRREKQSQQKASSSSPSR